MSRHILSLSHDQLTAFDLDAFVAHADALNQHNRDTFTTPFPKAPSRWLSHYEFTPHPIALTLEGDVDGGLSWLVGATLDFSFTRSLCAPSLWRPRRPLLRPGQPRRARSGRQSGSVRRLRPVLSRSAPSDKGRRYRQLAGLHDARSGRG